LQGIIKLFVKHHFCQLENSNKVEDLRIFQSVTKKIVQGNISLSDCLFPILQIEKEKLKFRK